MHSSVRMAGRPAFGSRRAFFDRDIVPQIQPPEMELQFAPNFYLSETRPVCTLIFRIRFGSLLSLAFLRSPSVAAFHGPNSDSRNGACFAISRQASKIIGLEDPYPYAAYLSVRPNSTSEGELCIKDTAASLSICSNWRFSYPEMACLESARRTTDIGIWPEQGRDRPCECVWKPFQAPQCTTARSSFGDSQ